MPPTVNRVHHADETAGAAVRTAFRWTRPLREARDGVQRMYFEYVIQKEGS